MVCRLLTCIIVTHADMLSCNRSSISYNTPSTLITMLSYHPVLLQDHKLRVDASKSRSSSVHYHSTSELLRTL
jgi:hypothetical protein